MEVYHDYVIDLLSVGTTLRTPLRVSEHPTTGPHVQGIGLYLLYLQTDAIRPRVGPFNVFTAQCTLVQSAVLRSHVVRLSVRPSVRLSVCLSVCDVGGL